MLKFCAEDTAFAEMLHKYVPPFWFVVHKQIHSNG